MSLNKIGDSGALSVISNFAFRNLRLLNLSANILGDKSAIAIGKNRRWIMMEELYLNENEIGDEGAIVIAQNKAWSRPQKIEIYGNNKITARGKKELGENPIFGSFVHV